MSEERMDHQVSHGSHQHDGHQHDGHVSLSRIPVLWQAALIGLTGVMLLFKIFTGALPLYIHTRYTPLITVTGWLLLLLAVAHAYFTLRDPRSPLHDHGPRSWRSPTMLALLLPILLGLLVPSKALGSAAIENRGFGTSGTGIRSIQTVAGTDPVSGIPDPENWTLLEWVNATAYQPDNPRVQGQPIEVIGFVWRREGMPAEQFVVSRFVVSCCTADSLAIGLPVVGADGTRFATDSWIRVKGTVGLEEIEGKQKAVILAEKVDSIPQPAEPYIYP